MGVALALVCVVDTNPLVAVYKVLVNCNSYKSSCTRVTRRGASVMRVGVVYVSVKVCVLRRLKEELAWAIATWLRLIINITLFKTVMPLRI